MWRQIGREGCQDCRGDGGGSSTREVSIIVSVVSHWENCLWSRGLVWVVPVCATLQLLSSSLTHYFVPFRPPFPFSLSFFPFFNFLYPFPISISSILFLLRFHSSISFSNVLSFLPFLLQFYYSFSYYAATFMFVLFTSEVNYNIFVVSQIESFSQKNYWIFNSSLRSYAIDVYCLETNINKPSYNSLIYQTTWNNILYQLNISNDLKHYFIPA